MAQPGSLRDCSVSFSNSAETSASCPTLAIQVTANTTIVRSFRGGSAGEDILGFLRGRLQLHNEVVYQNGVVTVGTGGNHADLGSGFFFDERQVIPRLLRQLVKFRDALGRSLP